MILFQIKITISNHDSGDSDFELELGLVDSIGRIIELEPGILRIIRSIAILSEILLWGASFEAHRLG